MSLLQASHLISSAVRTSVHNADDGPANSTETLIARRVEDYLDEVERAVQEVYQFAQEKAQYLANTLERDPDYYMSLMFRRCAFLHPMPKRMSYYMTSCMKRCDVVLEDASAEDLEAQREFLNEFRDLTGDQKDVLLSLVELERNTDRNFLAIRTDPSDRAQEVNDTFELIKALFLYLKCRCGVDGFICVVKNNDAYTLPPQWFFTSREINRHLSAMVGRWDARLIGRRLEEFSGSLRSSDRSSVVGSSMDECGTL